jgi:hypothetical protein
LRALFLCCAIALGVVEFFALQRSRLLLRHTQR